MPETAAVATMETVNEKLLAALATKDCLAEVLARQGKQVEAEAMLRHTLEIREKVLCQKREHPDIRRTMNNLAGTLVPEKIAEAEVLFRQVFEADEKALGCEHVYTITSMNNLAEILSRQGKHQEAVSLQRRTVNLSQIVRGSDHPQTVAIIDNLRELLTRKGENAEAEQMLQERPVLHQKMMERQNESKEEEILQRKALTKSRTDVDRIAALENLAMLLETEGRYTEAEDIFQQLVEISIDVHGSGYHGLQSSQRGLGVVMSKQHKYKEAEEVFRSLLLVQKTDAV